MPVKFYRIDWNDPAYDRQAKFRLPMHMPTPKTIWVGEMADAPSGDMDAFEEAVLYELEWEQQYIPAVGDVNQAGYYGVNGIAELLTYMRRKRPFRLIPDITTPGTFFTCKAVEVTEERMDTKNQLFRVRFRVRNTAAAALEV